MPGQLLVYHAAISSGKLIRKLQGRDLRADELKRRIGAAGDARLMTRRGRRFVMGSDENDFLAALAQVCRKSHGERFR